MLKRSCPNKTAILAFVFSLLICIHSIANSAICTWSASAAGNASSASNWSCDGSDGVPETDDIVVFNGTSNADCTWDIPYSTQIYSFSMDSGFQGTVSLDADMNIGTGGISITGGTFDAGSNTIIELEGDWFYFGGITTPLGDMNGNGEVEPDDVVSIFNMVMEQSPLLFCSDMNFDSSTDILDVVLSLRVALEKDGTPQDCSGGLFRPGTSTVRLTGTEQHITGDTVFYNLEKIAGCPGDTLYFEANSLQTILGRLTLTGEEGCLLALTKTEGGEYWFLSPLGTRNIAFASISYLVNQSSVDIIVTNSDEDVSNDNFGVSFGGSQCVCREDDTLILARVTCEVRGECYE